MNEKRKIILNVIEYVENNLDENLKLDNIANEVNYSKFHLNRLFYEFVGCTLHKYIQKRRLTEAAKKLVTTNKTISEIAFEANYESQQSFTLAFRQLYLYTPQIYRQLGVFIPKQNKYILNLKYIYGGRVA